MMVRLSHVPRGPFLLTLSSEMLLILSEVDPAIVPLRRIWGYKLFSFCFSKKYYYFTLDLETSFHHIQEPRLMFVFLTPLKMLFNFFFLVCTFGFVSFNQFWKILSYQLFCFSLPRILVSWSFYMCVWSLWYVKSLWIEMSHLWLLLILPHVSLRYGDLILLWVNILAKCSIWKSLGSRIEDSFL